MVVSTETRIALVPFGTVTVLTSVVVVGVICWKPMGVRVVGFTGYSLRRFVDRRRRLCHPQTVRRFRRHKVLILGYVVTAIGLSVFGVLLVLAANRILNLGN